MTTTSFTVRHSSLIAALFAAFAAVGCAGTIPNTTVDDTPENRDVVQFMESYRHAVEERNVTELLALASPLYLDDRGTISTDDDLDFDGLREKLSSWRDRVIDVRYEIKYRRVTYDEPRIFVEFRYTASFRVADPEGEEHWERRLQDHRLVLSRREEAEEGAEFEILSGM